MYHTIVGLVFFVIVALEAKPLAKPDPTQVDPVTYLIKYGYIDNNTEPEDFSSSIAIIKDRPKRSSETEQNDVIDPFSYLVKYGYIDDNSLSRGLISVDVEINAIKDFQVMELRL